MTGEAKVTQLGKTVAFVEGKLMAARTAPCLRQLQAARGWSRPTRLFVSRLRGAHRATAQPAAWQRKSALLPEADIGSASGHVGFVPWIGIGGSLAAPPLPHHRTYGSVYGGSRSYANALRSNDSTRVGWALGLIRRQERFDVFPSRLPGFTRRRR